MSNDELERIQADGSKKKMHFKMSQKWLSKQIQNCIARNTWENFKISYKDSNKSVYYSD